MFSVFQADNVTKRPQMGKQKFNTKTALLFLKAQTLEDFLRVILNVQFGILRCIWNLGNWVDISVFWDEELQLKKHENIDLIGIFLYMKILKVIIER